MEAVVPIPTFNSCLFLTERKNLFVRLLEKEWTEQSIVVLSLAYVMLSSTQTFDELSRINIYTEENFVQRLLVVAR